MITTLLGAAVGFTLAVAIYEFLILSHVRREIASAKQSIEALRPLASATPVRPDLSDTSPSLHL